MQGFYGRSGRRRRAVVRGHRAPLHAATFSFFLLAALAGCSSNSSWSGSSQSVAVAPPPNQPTYSSAAQAPSAPTQSQHVSGYPDQSITDAFRNSTEPTAATNPQHVSGYPEQSLTDLFRGSTQPQTVPRPPSIYTPSGQPYSPPGQPAAGPSQGVAPPAAADNGQHVSGYPDRSITDILH